MIVLWIFIVFCECIVYIEWEFVDVTKDGTTKPLCYTTCNESVTTPPLYPSPAFVSSFTSTDNGFYIYGGSLGSDVFSTLWHFDPRNNTWRWLDKKEVNQDQSYTYPNRHPGSREGPSMSFHEKTNTLYLFAGKYGGLESVMNDIWMWNISRGNHNATWELVDYKNYETTGYDYKSKLSDYSTVPGGRVTSIIAFDQSSDIFYMFGGHRCCSDSICSRTLSCSDFWHFNITSQNWTFLETSEQQRMLDMDSSITTEPFFPGATKGYRSNAWVDKLGFFYLHTYPGYLWKFDPSNLLWEVKNTSGLSSNYEQGTYTPGRRDHAQFTGVPEMNIGLMLGGGGYDIYGVYGILVDPWIVVFAREEANSRFVLDNVPSHENQNVYESYFVPLVYYDEDYTPTLRSRNQRNNSVYPSVRQGGVMAKSQEMVYLHGGYCLSSKFTGALWQWNTSKTGLSCYDFHVTPRMYESHFEDPRKCNDRGICRNVPFDDPTPCICDDGYFGRYCEITTCNGLFSNDTNNCGGNGYCFPQEFCNCYVGYYKSRVDPLMCNLTSCYGIWNNDSENVCSGLGSCNKTDFCECEPYRVGEECELIMCYGVLSDDTVNVCEGKGECVGPNECVNFTDRTSAQYQTSLIVSQCKPFLIRTNTTTTSFIQSMYRYEEGFGGDCLSSDTEDCWIGLSKLVKMATEDHPRQLLIQIKTHELPYTSFYTGFYVSNKSLDYRIYFDQGSKVDILDYSNPQTFLVDDAFDQFYGMKFQIDSNCSFDEDGKRVRGGWWYDESNCEGNSFTSSMESNDVIWKGNNIKYPNLEYLRLEVCDYYAVMDYRSDMTKEDRVVSSLTYPIQRQKDRTCSGYILNDRNHQSVFDFGGVDPMRHKSIGIDTRKLAIQVEGPIYKKWMLRDGPDHRADSCSEYFESDYFERFYDGSSYISVPSGYNISESLCVMDYVTYDFCGWRVKIQLPEQFWDSKIVAVGDSESVCYSKWAKDQDITEQYEVFCLKKCFDKYSDDDDVCSGKGACLDTDTCFCDHSPQISENGTEFFFFGKHCNHTYVKCNDSVLSTVDSCSNHGSCRSVTCFSDDLESNCVENGIFQSCDCELGYFDLTCSSWTCGSIYSNDSSLVCSGHGNCTSYEYCECESSEYTSEYCETPICFGDTETPCKNHGQCVGVNNCSCDPGTFSLAPDCGYFECFEIGNNDTEVCSGRGKCVDVDLCVCDYADFLTTSNCSSSEISQIKSIDNQIFNLGVPSSFEIPISSFTTPDDTYSLNDDTLTMSFSDLPDWIEATELPPEYISWFDSPHNVMHDIQARLPYLYFTTSSSKVICVLNVSNIHQPEIIGTSSVLPMNADTTYIKIRDYENLKKRYAFVTTWQEGLFVFDVTDPETVVEIIQATAALGNGYLRVVEIWKNQFCFVADYSYAKIHIFNCTDPVDNVDSLQAQYDSIPDDFLPYDVDVYQDDYVIGAGATDLFAIHQIMNGEWKRYPGNRRSYRDIQQNQVFGKYSFLSSLYKLDIFTLEDITFPEFVSSFTLDQGGELYHSHVLGGPSKKRIFWAGAVPKILVIDVSDVTNPTLIFDIPKEGVTAVRSITTQKNYIFTGNHAGDMHIFEYGSFQLEGAPDTCKTHEVTVTVRSNSGSVYNTTFSISVNFTGNNLVDENCTLSCNDVFSNDSSSVCGGHGTCIFTRDSVLGKCNCIQEGWDADEFCEVCSEGYSGDTCSPVCFGVFSNDTNNYCSGNGNCSAPNHCDCFSESVGTSDCYIGRIQQKEVIPTFSIQFGEQSQQYEISVSNFFVSHNNPNSEAYNFKERVYGKIPQEYNNDEYLHLEIKNPQQFPSFLNESKTIPKLVSSFDVLFGYSLEVRLPYVFFAQSQFSAYNLTNITDPKMLDINDELTTIDYLYIGEDLKYAYVADDDKFRILDLGDLRNISTVGIVIIDFHTQYGHHGLGMDMDESSKFMYVADYNNGVRVVDCNDVENPILKTTIAPGNEWSRDVFVDNNGIGIVPNRMTLIGFDASDLNNIEVFTTPPMVGYNMLVKVKKNVPKNERIAHVTDFSLGGLRIFDYSNLSNIHEVSYISGDVQAHGICMGGPDKTYTFVVSMSTGQVLGVDTSVIDDLKIVYNFIGPTAYSNTLSDCETQNNYFITINWKECNVYEYGSVSLTGLVDDSYIIQETGLLDSEVCGEANISLVVRTNYGDSYNTSFIVRLNTTNLGNLVDCFEEVYVCDNILSNDSTTPVCNGRGQCVFSPSSKSGKCRCDHEKWNEATFCGTCASGYSGYNCTSFSCFNILDNDTTNVCSGHGNCTGANKCTCFSNYSSHVCDVWYCNGTSRNETNLVCSGHGNCTKPEFCECHTNYFSSQCESFKCFGWINNDTSNVCSSHGNCIDHDTCVCSNSSIYQAEDCSYHTCFGYGNNATSTVCSDHGDCSDHDICNCRTNYTYSKDCSIWKCGAFYNNQSRDVCSGHGNCISREECDCLQLYAGELCQYWSCYGIPTSSVDRVCAGHGSCVSFDVCGCQSGYFPSTGKFGDTCDMWKCGSFQKNEFGGVCSGRGNCTSADSCDCLEGYLGDVCESWSCGGLDHTLPMVCRGHGSCEKPNECKCDESGQYVGEDCGTNLYLYVIMAPILGVFGLILTICVTVCILCWILCICVSAICIILALCTVLFSQGMKMKKFGKLDNINLLLEEQKADRDSTVAHIRITGTLFEIDFDSLKVERILGEGGSESVVYKANWRGKIVAFKCFKTRLICSSQDTFDEFEREVAIFSSISHPNVVRFFGCTMKPPRVGIVMEFCENGEMLEFILSYNDKNSKYYPIENKIRMLHEIAIGMEYLHHRNIIHRDLKCENVLIDRGESCKLMDFGLSKIASRMSQVKTKRVGTSYYMAPEVVKLGNYSEKCDVFSYSILCFITITEMGDPYDLGEDFGIEFKVANNRNFRPDIGKVKEYLRTKTEDGEKHMWICSVIMRAWTHNYKKRPSFRELNEMYQDIQSIRTTGSTKQMLDDLDDDGEQEKKRKEKKKKKKKKDLEYYKSEVNKLRKELEFYKLKFEMAEDKQQKKGGGGGGGSFMTTDGKILESFASQLSDDDDSDSGGEEESDSDLEGSTDEDDE